MSAEALRTGPPEAPAWPCRFCGLDVGRGGAVELPEHPDYRVIAGPEAPPQGWSRRRGVAVIADVAPLTDRHVLLLPPDHVSATALMPTAAAADLRVVAQRLVRKLSASGRVVVTFEHGSTPGPPHRAKCASTEHAHVHLVGLAPGADPLPALAAGVEGSGGTIERIPTGRAEPLREALRATGEYHVLTVWDGVGDPTVRLAVGAGCSARQVFRRLLVESGVVAAPDRVDWESGAMYPSAGMRADLVASAAFIGRALSPIRLEPAPR
ncbi:MAG TPA: hypothetical protein VF228_01265 [Iamia sp.]